MYGIWHVWHMSGIWYVWYGMYNGSKNPLESRLGGVRQEPKPTLSIRKSFHEGAIYLRENRFIKSGAPPRPFDETISKQINRPHETISTSKERGPPTPETKKHVP